MSTATEITRLQTARNTIRDKLIEFGLATSTAKLDALATAVDGIENKGAISASVQEGDTYTIPKGYHNGSGTVSGVAGGGNYSLQSKTVTPTKSQQSVTPDQGFYGLSDVTVKPIPETYQNVSAVTAAAGDVLANKVIVDAAGKTITGTMPNNGAVSKTLDTSTGNTAYTIPKGYHSGGGGVNIVPETKTATPTRASQDITPSPGKVLSKVTVGAIPADYTSAYDTVEEILDTNNIPLNPSWLLEGEVAYTRNGAGDMVEEVEGMMPNNGAVSKTLDASTGNQSYTIPEGYHNGSGKVQISLEEKTATPERTLQEITPSAGKVLSKVTVNAIPKTYQDAAETINEMIMDSVNGAPVYAADVLTGKVVYAGNENTGKIDRIVGAMPNNRGFSDTIDGLTKTSATIPAGYHDGNSTISLTNDIETALAAI